MKSLTQKVSYNVIASYKLLSFISSSRIKINVSPNGAL